MAPNNTATTVLPTAGRSGMGRRKRESDVVGRAKLQASEGRVNGGSELHVL
jgi:hypothetical protein